MTATTIPTTTPEAVPAPPQPRHTSAGASFGTTTGGTARRTILQFFRTPQLLLMGTIQGALFLFMFRYVFGGAISTGGAISYVDFLVPGFLVTTVLWTGMSARPPASPRTPPPASTTGCARCRSRGPR